MIKEITDVELSGINYWDAPDFCDAYIQRCLVDGEEATDEQLDMLNENGDLVYELVTKHLY